MIRRLGFLFLAAILVLLSPRAYAQGDGTEAPPTPDTPGTTIHVVQRGENLFRIAMRYGTTVDLIAQANGIQDVAAIKVGQRLLIPNVVSPQPGMAAPGVPTSYTVGPGDNLLNLAARFGTTQQAIALQNHVLNPAQLYIGQSIEVQEGSSGQPTVKNGWIHTVKPGEHIYRIAARYGVSLDALARANALKRLSVLYPGQRLIIPGADTTPPLAEFSPPLARVDMLPAQAEQGRTVLFRLTTSLPSRVEGTLMSRNLVVFSDPSRTQHAIIAGIDSLAQPGLYGLTIVATDDSGKQGVLQRNFAVADGGYPLEAIKLAAGLEDLLNPNLTGPEAQRVLQVVSKVTPTRYFGGPMGLPCPAPVTSQFGTRRSYNGGPFSFIHTGTDFAALPGSAIYAPAAGVVVMAETLNVRGNATIIDHGWGIYTGYWHQESIKVRVGDVVQAGQVIGTIGRTGRVTGPHLHWELFVEGVQVDPLQWVRQSFP